MMSTRFGVCDDGDAGDRGVRRSLKRQAKFKQDCYFRRVDIHHSYYIIAEYATRLKYTETRLDTTQVLKEDISFSTLELLMDPSGRYPLTNPTHQLDIGTMLTCWAKTVLQCPQSCT